VEFFSSLSLPDAALGCLLDQSLYTPIHRFYVTGFPLWKLGYLFEECWIEEDIINTETTVTCRSRETCDA